MSKYFATSDGEEFYTENNAQSHARTLADKSVTPPTIVVEEEDETADAATVNFSKMTKKQLIDFATSKGIEVDKKATNVVITTAIEEALATVDVIDLEVNAESETPKTEE